MKTVDKTDDLHMVNLVEIMWPEHHPWDIANHINARYGFERQNALTATAVWNLHHAAKRLDRERARA